MENKIITIKGMSCTSCAQRVEKILKKFDGVQNVMVNFSAEKVTFDYDKGITRPSAIYKAIEKAGYKVSEDMTEDATQHQKEIRTLWIKFISSIVFSIPLLYISMASMINFAYLPFSAELHDLMQTNPLTYALIQLFLTLPVMCVGYEFYTVGFKSLLQRSPNMDSLIAIGTSSAAIYSIFNTWQIAKNHTDAVDSLYFETTAVIISLILLGKALEAASKGKTGEAIKKLMDLAPKTAVIFQNDVEKEVPIEEVKIGDIIIVKPGSKIPADGTVVNGHTFIDESMLTGESMPVDKSTGDPVYAATMNTTGVIRFKVEKTGNDTALSKIVKLVEDAQSSKAPIAKIADTVSGYFVPVVCIIAILAGIVWFFINGGDLKFSLKVFICVLVISCPCALGLATPAAIIVGTGKGAQKGILIKNGEALERAHKINTVVLDKTGTITEGKPYVTDILTFGDMESDKLLQIAASAEKDSEHPLGQAITALAETKGLEFLEVDNFNSLTGRGIEAIVDEQSVLIGSQKLIRSEKYGISLESLGNIDADKFADDGKTIVYLAVNGELAGIIAVADILKPSAKPAVESLIKMGIKVVMITGDNLKTASTIAKQVGIGIDQVFADVLPQDKADLVKTLQSDGVIAMVGDGINDAPALVQADIGIAIGSGTDIAMESADIVLVRSDLSSVPTAIELSRATMKNIKQNLFWAFSYNVLGIPIAALGLLNPMIAAAAMCFSDVSLILNVLRLKRKHL